MFSKENGKSSSRWFLRRRFLSSLPFLEKRRPRSLGFDSDSLATRSSGKLNLVHDTLFIYPSSLQSTLTHLHASKLSADHTRVCAHCVTWIQAQEKHHRKRTHMFYYSHLFIMMYGVPTFSLSFSLTHCSLYTLIIKTLGESLCIPALFCRRTFAEKTARKYFPKVPRHRADAFLIQTNCAVGKIIISPRTSETVRNKGKSISRDICNDS